MHRYPAINQLTYCTTQSLHTSLLRSKFFIDYRGTPREQAMLTEGRIEKRMCTDSATVRMSGLELCASLSIPKLHQAASAPHFPLAGPKSISLVLNKKDTYRGFHFETEMGSNVVRPA